ncbi:hypothetical protein ACRE_019310 [Hapsidospora chrysogenum ATCC 11550]|uniref:Uncharacterized protein n=1 Tax=Hapsidospora chrysogenum (strain ATCC 11550 / CBS 779.69 / DSM 880 / IAM 14645 / JCM 23072 / IMI 49137) TaxID=857340 RepID=A0A086TD71_HAPC1|nr:hypothetical protein ACRE_019310 [Hapsidospora chrysogenum ATCC 11550]
MSPDLWLFNSLDELVSRTDDLPEMTPYGWNPIESFEDPDPFNFSVFRSPLFPPPHHAQRSGPDPSNSTRAFTLLVASEEEENGWAVVQSIDVEQ